MARAPTLLPKIETRVQTRLAPRWKVILHDDDITTIDFVVRLLVRLFHKDRREAERLTHEVDDTGSAVIEITTFERGELYVEQIRSTARPYGFPLCATLEPE